MQHTIPATDPAHKGQSEPVSPPIKPGLELARKIAQLTRSGRPGWPIGPVPGELQQLYVPRALMRFTGQEVAPGTWRVDDPFPVPNFSTLPPRLALAMRTLHRVDFDSLETRDLAAGNQLHAAALKDIAGLDEASIAEICGWAGNHAERTARDAIAKGRIHWRAMAAWPWLEFALWDGRPPPGWRQGTTADSRFVRSLETWRTGRLHLAAARHAR